MMTLDEFIAGLGDHARKYDPAQLKRLYADSVLLARLLVNGLTARATNKQQKRYRQHRLDELGGTATLESSTAHDEPSCDGSSAPKAPNP